MAALPGMHVLPAKHKQIRRNVVPRPATTLTLK